MTARAVVAHTAGAASLRVTVLLDRRDDILVSAHARRISRAQVDQVSLQRSQVMHVIIRTVTTDSTTYMIHVHHAKFLWIDEQAMNLHRDKTVDNVVTCRGPIQRLSCSKYDTRSIASEGFNT